MKANTIYKLDGDMTVTNPYKTKLIKEVDLGRYGVFVVESVSFNWIKSEVVRSYSIEAYSLQPDGYAELIDGQYFKTKKEVLAAFKTYVIPEEKVG